MRDVARREAERFLAVSARLDLQDAVASHAAFSDNSATFGENLLALVLRMTATASDADFDLSAHA